VETGRIGLGLLLFLGVGREDAQSDADWLAARLLKLRVFESEPGRMDRSLADIDGECLVISQFTLFGSLKKGNRPSFNRAAPPDEAAALYGYFVEQLSAGLGRAVPTGRFGEHMHIDAQNDGPVTLVVDSKVRDF
jgi:D-tyrosyl-tRNA(Tyr) deacylase